MKISFELYKGGTWNDNETVEFFIDDEITLKTNKSIGETCGTDYKLEKFEKEFLHEDSHVRLDFRTGFDEDGGVWT